MNKSEAKNKLIGYRRALDRIFVEPVDAEPFDMTIEALEKQIPRMVGYIGDGYADGVMVYNQAECPTCGYIYDDTDSVWKEPFCPHCGQAIKWG